jgi:hypothetical protein
MSAAIGHLRATFSDETLASLAVRDLALEQGVLEVPRDSHRSIDLAARMTTADYIHLELSRSEVEDALLANDTEWLARCADLAAAAIESESPTLSVELHQALVASLSVNLGVVHPLIASDGRRDGEGEHTIPIVVESSAPESLRIGFVGSIRLKSLDERRTVLELDGKSTFGPQLAVPLNADGQSTAHVIAARLMRAFLRHVAEELESRRVKRATLPA